MPRYNTLSKRASNSIKFLHCFIISGQFINEIRNPWYRRHGRKVRWRGQGLIKELIAGMGVKVVSEKSGKGSELRGNKGTRELTSSSSRD